MRIVSRAEWGARYARGVGPAPLPATYLYIHHSVTAAKNGPEVIRQIEQIGQDRFGAGISYTFLVTPDGTIYEGHGVDRKGSHTRGLNSTARAICAVGNYDTTHPSPALLRSIADLARHGREQGWWGEITGGHRQAPGASTACPGRFLQAAIPEIKALAAASTTEDPMTEQDFERIKALIDEKVDAEGHETRTWIREELKRQLAALKG